MKLHIHCVISFPTPALLSVGAPLVGALARPPFWPATVQSSSPHARVPTGVKLRIHCSISFSTPTQQPVGAPLVGALSRPPFWPATVQSSSPHARVPTGVKMHIHCVISFPTPALLSVGAPLVGALSRPPILACDRAIFVSPREDTHRSKIAHPLFNFLLHTYPTTRRGTPCGCPCSPHSGLRLSDICLPVRGHPQE